MSKPIETAGIKMNPTSSTSRTAEFGIAAGILVVMLGVAASILYWHLGDDGSGSRSASGSSPASPSQVTSTPQPVLVPITAMHAPDMAPPPVTPNVRHADIYFDFNQSRLRTEAMQLLQQHAKLVKADGQWAVLIQGYADQQGPAAYNKVLARKRGEAVKAFLVELGLPASSMTVVSLGKEAAICADDSDTCQRLNRRVHVDFIQYEAPAVFMKPITETTPPMKIEEGNEETGEGVDSQDRSLSGSDESGELTGSEPSNLTTSQ